MSWQKLNISCCTYCKLKLIRFRPLLVVALLQVSQVGHWHKSRQLCKQIIWVDIYVLGIDEKSYILQKVLLLNNDLQTFFHNASDNIQMISKQVIQDKQRENHNTVESSASALYIWIAIL